MLRGRQHLLLCCHGRRWCHRATPRCCGGIGGGGGEQQPGGLPRSGFEMLRRVLLAVRSAKASVGEVLAASFAGRLADSYRDMHAESRSAERENRMHDHEDTPGRVTFMANAAYLGASELNTSTHLGLMWALTLADQHAILGPVIRTRFNFSLTDCAIYRFYSRLQYCTGEDGVDQPRLRRFYGGLVHLPGAAFGI